MNKTVARVMALAVSLTATAFAGAAYGEQTQARVLTRAEAQNRAAAVFTRMDVNKDGKFDLADREARRANRFDRLDADHNGQLSRQEFSARPQRPAGADAGRREERGSRWWGARRHGSGMMVGRAADANKDGAITQAEFTTAMAQRFDRLDANKDGQVSGDERQAARGATRHEGRGRHPHSAN